MNLRISSRFAKVPEPIRVVVHAGVLEGLNVSGARGVDLVVGFIVAARAVAFGNLVNAVKFDPVTRVDISGVEIKAVAPADVYVDPVETGTKPHFPPSSALVPWVKQKLHVTDEKQAMSIAFLIARKIARVGTKGVFMFKKAYDVLSLELKGIFEAAIARNLQARGVGKK